MIQRCVLQGLGLSERAVGLEQGLSGQLEGQQSGCAAQVNSQEGDRSDEGAAEFRMQAVQ